MRFINLVNQQQLTTTHRSEVTSGGYLHIHH